MAKDPYLDKDGLETFYNMIRNRLTSYCKKDESFYTTTQADEYTIPIGISGFRNTDVLFVDINGLDLVAGEDYTISGTNIVLSTPIGSVGQTVHFLALRTATLTAQDYSALKGDPGEDGVDGQDGADGRVQDVLLDSTSVVGNDGIARINKSALIDIFYPVGSYYETSNANFDPNTAWGGTWVLDSKGKVTVGYDSDVTAFNQVGKTGGTRDAIVPYHRHSVAKVTTGGGTQHRHSFSMYKAGGFNHPSSGTTHTVYYAAAGNQTVYTSYESSHTHDVPAHNTNYEGTSGNATNANLQPYIVVNRWHRTA